MDATSQYHNPQSGPVTEPLQIAHGIKEEPWIYGAEEYRGKRLLPHVIDYYAQNDPHRVYAVIPTSGGMEDSMQDIEMYSMASAINNIAWWIDHQFESVQKGILAYVGPSDLRYPIVFLASIKCRWKVRDLASFVNQIQC